jgi:Tol biopolymer transport system component
MPLFGPAHPRSIPPSRRATRTAWTALARAGVLLGALIGPLTAIAQPAELISRPPDPLFFEGFGNGNSGGIGDCRFADDGSRLTYSSMASNLVNDDSNGSRDVFTYDLGTGITRAVSRTSSGELADDVSGGPAINADGRYVLFESQAGNLGVTGSFQGFRHDLDTGISLPIGFAPDGSEFSAADPSDLSGDGRLAVFTADDQTWLRDIDAGTTQLITEGVDGQPADSFTTRPRISADGSLIVFYSPATNLVAGDGNGERDVFVHDVALGVTSRIEGIGGAEPDGESELVQISADGRWIVFESDATNLVALDTEGQRDIFLHDLQSGITSRISQDASGVGGNALSRRPSISQDGRFVVFESEADNLVPGLTGIERRLFLYDRQFDTLARIAADAPFPQSACVTSNGNSGWVAYQATEHPLIPARLRHQQLVLEPFTSSDPDRIIRGGSSPVVVSRSTPPLSVRVGTGNSQGLAQAAGGGYLAFRTNAGNLLETSPGGTQIVRLNTQTGGYEIASRGFDGEPAELAFPATAPSISASGERVAFLSRSANLVPGDTNNLEDVFVRDLAAGQILRASVASNGDEADGDSQLPTISADGSAVVFRSTASNLVTDDTNGDADIFLRQLGSGITERVSLAVDGSEPNERSDDPAISGNGRFIAFTTRADLLDPGGAAVSEQVWLRDRQLGTTELISARPDGQPANGISKRPALSASGRWVAFRSSATDIDPSFPAPPGDSIYLHDRQSGVTRLVSVDAEGNAVAVDTVEGPVLAIDGSAVLFRTFIDTGGNKQNSPRGAPPEGSLFVHRVAEQVSTAVLPTTTDGQPPDAELVPAAIEAGGRILYLETAATNLVRAMAPPYLDVYRIDLDRIFGDGFEP